MMRNSAESAAEQICTTRGDRSVRRFISADRVEIVGDDIGPAGAPVILLLHGGGQTRHSWSGAARALAVSGYRVINYDARGHGDSDWSPIGAYSLDDRVADLRAIVGEVDRPFALVGASLGGATAIHAVALGMEPAAIVLVDIVPEPEAAGVDRIVAFMRANPDGFASIEAAADAVSAYNPDRPKPDDPAGLRRNLRLRENGRLYWHWDPRITSDAPRSHHATVRHSAASLADRADLAVLLVRGMKSEVVSDAGVAAFRAIVPRLEVADVGGAGHMVAGDRNDAFNASIIPFLRRNLPIDIA